MSSRNSAFDSAPKIGITQPHEAVVQSPWQIVVAGAKSEPSPHLQPRCPYCAWSSKEERTTLKSLRE